MHRTVLSTVGIMVEVGAESFFLAAVALLIVSFISSAASAQLNRVEISDPKNIADDQFGYSVAISGQTVVVGAPQFIGGLSIAYVYLEEGGTWVQAAQLNDGSADQFGWSVAASERVIAVGTPHAENNTGAVYVFVKPPGGWKDMPPTAELTLSPGDEQALGVSLAISGDGQTIVAGGQGESVTGDAYVFVEPAGGWTNTTQPTATLTSSNGFGVGRSIAISSDGTTIVAGEDSTGRLNSAYVFVEPPEGWMSTTQPTASLTASDQNAVDAFAHSVAISGNTIVVGSPEHANGKNPLGAAYVYVEPVSGWQDMTQTAELTNPSLNKTPFLGASVAVEENVVLAGAPGDGQGSVFAYLKPSTGWTNSSTPNGSVAGSGGQYKQKFGLTLALGGNTFVVGAPYYGGSLQGAIYIFSEQ